MAGARRETPEDRALASAATMYDGQLIDVRWSGSRPTPEGVYHPVDYKNGITHRTIADEHGNQITGSGSVMTRPPIMRLFDFVPWARITYFEPTTFRVELKGSLHDNGFTAAAACGRSRGSSRIARISISISSTMIGMTPSSTS